MQSIIYVIKKPKLLINYITLKDKLRRSLDISKSQINQFIKEYNSFKNYLEKNYGNLPHSILTPIRGKVLYCVISAIMPKIIVETSVALGVSSFLILNAIKLNKIGTLYSIDLPNKDIIGNKEVGFVVPKELRSNWKLILGDSKTELPKLLSELKQVNIFFHDSLHTYEHMMFEFETVWPHIKENGLIVSDDIYWNNAFIDFAKKVNSQYTIFDGIGIIKKVS